MFSFNNAKVALRFFSPLSSKFTLQSAVGSTIPDIAVIGTGVVSQSGGGTLTTAWPASYSPVANDISVIMFGIDTSDYDDSAVISAGWIKIYKDYGGPDGEEVVIFMKRLVGSESTPSITSISTAYGMFTQNIILRNVSADVLLDIVTNSAVQNTSGNSTPATLTIPTLTTVTNKAYLLTIVTFDTLDTGIPTITAPSGWTKFGAADSANYASGIAFGRLTTTAGSVTSATSTITTAGSPVGWLGVTIGFNPIAASSPGQVTNLVAGITSATTQALTWTEPLGHPSTYLIEYKLSASGSWSTFSHTASTSTTAIVTGLTASNTYNFRVSAINFAGTGSVSSTVTTTTPASSSLVTVFPLMSTTTNVNTTGAATVGYNYLSWSHDGALANSNYSVVNGTDGSITAKMIGRDGVVTIGLHNSNTTADPSTWNFAVANSGGSGYQIYIGGSPFTPNVNQFLVCSIGDFLRIRMIGNVVVAEVMVINTTVWQLIHIFAATPSAGGTYFPQVYHLFDNSGVGELLITQGKQQAYWADQTVNIVMDGNSLMARDPGNGTPAQRLAYLSPLLGSRTTITDVSVDGQTTRQMNGLDGGSRSDLDGAWVSGKINILVLWEGTNSIFPASSETYTQAATDMANLIAAAQAVHTWNHVIVINTIPREGGFSDGTTLTNLNIALENYNSYLATNRASMGITRIVDCRQSGSPYIFSSYTAADFTAASNWYYDVVPNCIHLSIPGLDLILGYLIVELNQLGIT